MPVMTQLAAFGMINATLTALRLSVSQRVGTAGTVTFYGQGSYGGGESSPAWRSRLLPRLELTSEVIEELRADYSLVREVLEGSNSQVRVALRRFAASCEPKSAEDRIIDLSIALEALFTPAGSQSEMTYRISVNGANYIEIPGRTRREVQQWLTGAYGVRSKIVHGGAVAAKDTPDPLIADSPGGLEGLADDMTLIVRLSLRRALHSRVDWNGDQIADFTALLFPEPQRQAPQG